MGAPKGNEYYKVRLSEGRNLKFDSPEDLETAANKYFQHVLDNPLIEEVVVSKSWKDEEGIVHPYFTAKQNKMRAFTYEGLCNFLNITCTGLNEYKKRKDFSDVYTHIRQIIDMQQFEGAASGFLKENIIARKLGLKDKSESVNKNINVELSDQDNDDLITQIEEEAKKLSE